MIKDRKKEKRKERKRRKKKGNREKHRSKIYGLEPRNKEKISEKRDGSGRREEGTGKRLYA